MPSGIYQIKNIANNKIYIGSSYRVERRWLEHRYELRRNNHYNPYLQQSWNKYREQTFEFEILEICQPEDLVTIEQYYFDWLEPFKDRGYNIAYIAKSVMRNRKHTIEAKAKMSTSHKGCKAHNKGMPMDEKQKEKIRLTLRGRHLTEEHKANISKALKGRHHSEITKKKISVAERITKTRLKKEREKIS